MQTRLGMVLGFLSINHSGLQLFFHLVASGVIDKPAVCPTITCTSNPPRTWKTSSDSGVTIRLRLNPSFPVSSRGRRSKAAIIKCHVRAEAESRAPANPGQGLMQPKEYPALATTRHDTTQYVNADMRWDKRDKRDTVMRSDVDVHIFLAPNPNG